jgi:hypothetical protein
MLDLDFQIIQIILSNLSPTWIDRWDDFLEEYFMGMFPEDCRPIKDNDIMLIKEYVSERGFSTKNTINAVNTYIYLMAEYYLVNEPEIQEKLLSLGCKVPIQRNDKE